MFWNRAAREARRQKVLDDLIDLDPEERRLRINQAVAEGDVRAGEVEEALKLVSRLNSLRVMTIPGARDAAPSTASTTEGAPENGPVETVAMPLQRGHGRVAIEVAPGPIDVPGRGTGASRQTRAIAREAAVHKAVRAIGGSPRRRRLRLAASVRARTQGVAAASAVMPAAPDAPLASSAHEPRISVAPEAIPEEEWPSIDWLRP